MKDRNNASDPHVSALIRGSAFGLGLLALLLAGCANLPNRKKEIAENWDQHRSRLKFELASAELRNGRMESARKLAQEAVNLDTESAVNHEVLAQSYIATGDFRAAEQILATLVMRKPESAQAWFLLGTLHERERDWAMVIDDYTRAWQGAPGKLEYLLALAQALSSSGESSRALALLKEQEPSFGAEPVFHVARAELHRQQDDLPQAATAYRAALALGLEDPGTRKNFGLVLNWLGQHKEALENLGPALATVAQPEAAAACAFVSSAIADGQHRRALRWMDRKDLKLPASAKLELLRSQALAKEESFEPALAAAQKACKLDPDFIDAQLLTAGLLAKLGRKEACLRVIEDALRMQPRSAEAWTVYAHLLERFGESDSAELARQKAKAVGMPAAVLTAGGA